MKYIKWYNNRVEVKERLKKYKQKYNKKLKVIEWRKEYMRKYTKKPENKIKINNYLKKKRKEKSKFRIMGNLRMLLYLAMRRYSKTGKIMSSMKYGIDYKAIIEHLKPFPDNLSDYEVDHIKPLSLFNLNDKEEVKKAFAPENHQWLLAPINRSKGAKYPWKI